VQWFRALSESDVYLRCYGERTGTVDVVNGARPHCEPPVARLKIDPDLILLIGANEERQIEEQPAEAA